MVLSLFYDTLILTLSPLLTPPHFQPFFLFTHSLMLLSPYAQFLPPPLSIIDFIWKSVGGKVAQTFPL